MDVAFFLFLVHSPSLLFIQYGRDKYMSGEEVRDTGWHKMPPRFKIVLFVQLFDTVALAIMSINSLMVLLQNKKIAWLDH